MKSKTGFRINKYKIFSLPLSKKVLVPFLIAGVIFGANSLHAQSPGTTARPKSASGAKKDDGKILVIDITDMYIPRLDGGDNVDLIMPYGLPEIDLKAVVLDVQRELIDGKPYLGALIKKELKARQNRW